MTALTAGQDDAVSIFVTVGNVLAAPGRRYHAMTLIDDKVPAHADDCFTAQDRIARHGNMIGRRVAATA